MVATSKILTVSYGTFSCTLEGFDEPFATMKAIAEYFRDLAADDRYFGAEPPTPDAEMLHRIAEREIKRRVEAKINASGIVLRAQDSKPAQDSGQAQEADVPAAPSPRPASRPETPPAPPSDDSLEDDQSDAETAADAHGESVAEKLMRIRAVVAARNADLPAGGGAARPGDTPADADLSDADLTDGSDAYGDLSEEDFGFDLDLPGPPAIADRPGPRAPAAQPGNDDTAGQAGGSADAPARPGNAGLSFAQRARAQVIKHRRQNVDPQPVAPAETPAESPAESPAAAPQPAPGQAAAGAPSTQPQEETVDAIIANISATLDAAGPESAPEEDSDDPILANISASLGNTGLDAEDEEDLLRELVAAARSAVARDMHEGRAILEGAAGDEEAALSRLMDEANTKLEGDENRRRFSAISHLKAAVAATFADRKMKSADTPADPGSGRTREIDRYRDDLSKVVRPQRGDTADTGPDTGADKSGDRGARPSPLVLVSEQRIASTGRVPAKHRPAAPADSDDDEDDADAYAGAMPSPESARSFAQYAERMGAKGLPDLLELAAAYTANVEGLPHFSRPQLLLKVAHAADEAHYSREDGLRSFGMLLREGKIKKLRRGQFKITDASKYMPGARRA
ncbi:MAG: hypothetical protein H6901_02530 [Rhodobacteraceae bacterium]|nr:hypothetical protein [Paracoccaceae bacterium]MCP5341073.1 hypothetical protein [Paracoccaceae bacterium]